MSIAVFVFVVVKVRMAIFDAVAIGSVAAVNSSVAVAIRYRKQSCFFSIHGWRITAAGVFSAWFLYLMMRTGDALINDQHDKNSKTHEGFGYGKRFVQSIVPDGPVQSYRSAHPPLNLLWGSMWPAPLP